MDCPVIKKRKLKTAPLVCHNCGHFKYMNRIINKIHYNEDYKYKHKQGKPCEYEKTNDIIYTGWHLNCSDCEIAAKRLNHDKPLSLKKVRLY